MSQDNTIPRMASPVTITTINGKQFVSGLFWQPLTRPRAYMKEAREIGSREGMDIVAIRHSTIMQAGFVAKDQGVLKGMYSMAASLAGRLGPSWLGVFELDDGTYAFVAVNDGAIVPGCDMVGDREEVREKLNYIYSFFSWEKVYVPADFDYGGETVDIKTLLVPGSLQKEHRLKQLTFGLTNRELLLGVGAVVAIVIGGVGYMQLQAVEEKKARMERIRAEQIRQQQLAELNAKTKREQSVNALAHPWAKLPAADDFISSCVAGINAMPLTINGWVFQSAKCGGNQLAATYGRRGTATVNDFISGAKGRFVSEPAFLEEGESVAVHTELKLMYGGDDVLQPLAPMLSSFTSHFQALDIKLKLTEKPTAPEKPKPLPGQTASQPDNEVEVVPDWKTYTFSFDTELAPELAFTGLNGSGVRFTEVAVKLQEETSKLTWNVAGEIYAK